MYFFDFFYKRNNQYRSSFTFLRSVAEFICSANKRFNCSKQKQVASKPYKKKLKVTRQYTSVSRLIAKLEPLYTFARYNAGLATFDEMRSFLIKWSSPELYHPPSTLKDML